MQTMGWLWGPAATGTCWDSQGASDSTNSEACSLRIPAPAGSASSVISNRSHEHAWQCYFLTGHFSQAERPGADQGSGEVFLTWAMNKFLQALLFLTRRIFCLPLTKESSSHEWQLLFLCEPHSHQSPFGGLKLWATPQQEQPQQRAFTARKSPKRCRQENKAYFTNTQTKYLNFKQGIKSLTLF